MDILIFLDSCISCGSWIFEAQARRIQLETTRLVRGCQITRVLRHLEFGDLPSCVLNDPDWKMRQILGMMQNEADLRMWQN